MSARTKHPAAGCTKAQREAFEQCCIGDDRGLYASTWAALVRRGLVVEREETLPPNKSCPWPLTVKRYSVPLAIHAQWCAWCADNVPDEVA